MRGYSIHLFFHLLAALLGAAAGVAAGLWWIGAAPVGLWLAIGALLVGVLVLAVESLYLPDKKSPATGQPSTAARTSAAPAGSRRAAHSNHDATRVQNARSTTGTRPDIEPVAAPEPTEDQGHHAPTRRI